MMTSKDRPAAMRASDADRDAVVSDLAGHFQAGRLTAAELDDRTGRALTARTWGELPGLPPIFPPCGPQPRQRPPPPGGHSRGPGTPRPRRPPRWPASRSLPWSWCTRCTAGGA
jgi:Domain of unknown function (DUF1707)